MSIENTPILWYSFQEVSLRQFSLLRFILVNFAEILASARFDYSFFRHLFLSFNHFFPLSLKNFFSFLHIDFEFFFQFKFTLLEWLDPDKFLMAPILLGKGFELIFTSAKLFSDIFI